LVLPEKTQHFFVKEIWCFPERGYPGGGDEASAEPPRASSLKMKQNVPEKITERFCNGNRSLIDPDLPFDRDRYRDQQTKIANRFENKNRDPILILKSRIDFRKKGGSRSNAPSDRLM
jgi:hypothetical protein